MKPVRTIVLRLSALLVTRLLLESGRANAFAEDLCHEDGRVMNCVEGDREGRRPRLIDRFRAMFGLWSAAQEKNGRSMIHVDSTFFIAQAVGLRWEVAYWIAAYDQVPDVAQYVPFGSDGRKLTELPRWHTLRLNGWHRLARDLGGTLYHFPAPYLPPGTTRLPPSIQAAHPNLDDSFHEGTLVHFRRWALEGTHACTGGFTTRAPDGSYFTGASCFPGRPEENITGRFPVLGRLVGFRFSGGTGPQIARLLEEGGARRTALPADTLVLSAELQKLLDASTGRLGDEDAPVPSELVKMGIYLHILQDRISHERCLNHSYVTGPGPDGRFRYHFDRRECTPPKHALGHFQELGWPNLPERTLPALEYTFDELSRFVDVVREKHPDWLSDAPRLDRARLIRDAGGTPGILATVLSVKNGCERLSAMNRALLASGFQPHHAQHGSQRRREPGRSRKRAVAPGRSPEHQEHRSAPLGLSNRRDEQSRLGGWGIRADVHRFPPFGPAGLTRVRPAHDQ